MKVFSQEIRYKIVEVLIDCEKRACEILYLIGRTQSNALMYLKKLTDL